MNEYKTLRKLQTRYKNDTNYISTIKVNRITLNNNNNKKNHHPDRILIICGLGPEKTNVLLNLINHKPDFAKIYLHVKDQNKTKYQFLLNKHEQIALRHFKEPHLSKY